MVYHIVTRISTSAYLILIYIFDLEQVEEGITSKTLTFGDDTKQQLQDDIGKLIMSSDKCRCYLI